MKVVSVENVSKKFILSHNRPRNLADGLRSLIWRSRREDLWALKDVSFEIEQGEALGIIGHNGAGKSTMLKLLTRIMEPTKGRIRTRGRVSALIEVGAGFHPEMTGRENIFLNGAILGMTRREIDRKFEEIVAFAELEKFIDTPVKRYSSGMYARLAMGVAVHVQPDILVVDEVLAVGDFAFQTKCVRAMQERRRSGVSVVFVSHNMGLVDGMCDTALLLQSGNPLMLAKASRVIAEYRRLELPDSSDGDTDLTGPAVRRHGDGSVRINRVRFLNGAGSAKAVAEMGSDLVVEVHYECHAAVGEVQFALRVIGEDGTEVTRPVTSDHGQQLSLDPGRGVVRYVVPYLYLHPGEYTIIPGVWEQSGFGCFDEVTTGVTLVVGPGDPGYKIRERAGLVHLVGTWEHHQFDGGECGAK
jgi:ABC-type polysaccharide/polyol phosphate transport system ATPase subunit